MARLDIGEAGDQELGAGRGRQAAALPLARTESTISLKRSRSLGWIVE